MKEQLPAGAVIQHKIQIIRRLKRVMQTNDEGMLGVPQHTSLRVGMLHLLPLDDVVFTQHLHRVHLACNHHIAITSMRTRNMAQQTDPYPSY